MGALELELEGGRATYVDTSRRESLKISGLIVLGLRCVGGFQGVLPAISFIVPVASPSCLTPIVQHFWGGWDVIVLGKVLGLLGVVGVNSNFSRLGKGVWVPVVVVVGWCRILRRYLRNKAFMRGEAGSALTQAITFGVSDLGSDTT